MARSSWKRRLLTLLLALGTLVGLAADLPAQSVEAQTQPFGAWQRLSGLPGKAPYLVTPESGALFARGDFVLYRSDDAGDTWRTVSSPEPKTNIAVTPTNHTILYAGYGATIHKSVDDGASWRPIKIEQEQNSIVVSPADQDLVFIRLSLPSTPTWYRRSRDVSATWEDVHGPGDLSQLFGGARINLKLHPTDPRRAFTAGGCETPCSSRSLDFGVPLIQTFDEGDTWVKTSLPQVGVPIVMAGGAGVAPDRFYVASYGGAIRGSRLYRSDDDAATWTTIHDFADGVLTSLAHDRDVPDRLFVGLNVGNHLGRVLTSADGGTTWDEIGRPDIRWIRSVEIGVDRRHLYVGTDDGIWRLPLQY